MRLEHLLKYIFYLSESDFDLKVCIKKLPEISIPNEKHQLRDIVFRVSDVYIMILKEKQCFPFLFCCFGFRMKHVNEKPQARMISLILRGKYE